MAHKNKQKKPVVRKRRIVSVTLSDTVLGKLDEIIKSPHVFAQNRSQAIEVGGFDLYNAMKRREAKAKRNA